MRLANIFPVLVLIALLSVTQQITATLLRQFEPMSREDLRQHAYEIYAEFADLFNQDTVEVAKQDFIKIDPEALQRFQDYMQAEENKGYEGQHLPRWLQDDGPLGGNRYRDKFEEFLQIRWKLVQARMEWNKKHGVSTSEPKQEEVDISATDHEPRRGLERSVTL